MAPGRAVLWAAMVPWLALLHHPLPTLAQLEPTPPITIRPADPPSPDAIEIRLYEQINTGAGITLLQNTRIGQEIVIEHHIDLTNLPTITILDEVYPYSGLSFGTYTLRWIKHYEYAGEVTDVEVSATFDVPVTEPIAFPVPGLSRWALLIALGLLARLLAVRTRRYRPLRAGKT